MFRRKELDAAALRAIEAALEAVRPAALTEARRDALRLRVMSQLGPQAPAGGGVPELLRRRWVALPAATAIAGVMLVAAQLVDGSGPGAQAYIAHADGDVEVNGLPGSNASAGDVILARSSSWLSIGPDVRVGMEPGAALRYDQAGDVISVAVQAGDVTVASAAREVAVSQPQWHAAVRPSSVATFSLSAVGTTVNVASGEVQVSSAGQTYSVTAGNSPMRIPVAATPGATATRTATPRPSASPTATRPSPSPSASASPGPSSTVIPPVYAPPQTSAPPASASPSVSPSATPGASVSPSPTAGETREPHGDDATVEPTADPGAGTASVPASPGTP